MYYVAGSPGRVFLYTIFTETWIIYYDSSDQSFQLFFFFIPEELPQQMDLRFDLALILHRMPLLMQTLPFIREWDQCKEYTSLWSPEGGLLPAPVSSCGSYTCKACSPLRRIYNHIMLHHVNGSLSWLLCSFDFTPPLRIKYWAEIKMPFVVVLYHAV